MRSSAKQPARPIQKRGSEPPSPSSAPRIIETKLSKRIKPGARVRPKTVPPRAKELATATLAGLRALYPDAHCELNFRSPFELIVSVVLSAQTTDVLVNKVTPHLFARFPDARALAAADPAEVAQMLASRGMGMFNQKGKNIVGLSKLLVERHGAEVPRTMSELLALPGVGRKTANVVLGELWGTPDGVVVDTHVQRLSQRLGWTKNTTPELIETDLCALFPRSEWAIIAHTLIFHGRRVCFARKPACASCGVSELCPSAFKAETIGRKPQRVRPRPPAESVRIRKRP